MAKNTIVIRNESLRKAALLTIGALDLDKPWTLTIERETKRRTLSQNNLMWKWHESVVKAIHEHSGTDKDEVHEFFKRKFAPVRYVDIAGELVEYRSTKHLTSKEMTDYLNKIYAWATAEGYFLPVPEDLGRDKAA